jgi:nicotinamidase-related amidase
VRTEKAMLGNGALLLIDVQRGFHDPSWGQRNNLDAEKNINALLDIFRKRKMSVIHVQHISKDPRSAAIRAEVETQ